MVAGSGFQLPPRHPSWHLRLRVYVFDHMQVHPTLVLPLPMAFDEVGTDPLLHCSGNYTDHLSANSIVQNTLITQKPLDHLGYRYRKGQI